MEGPSSPAQVDDKSKPPTSSARRPPPVLDDNLWQEIATEVKRKSLHPETPKQMDVPSQGAEQEDASETVCVDSLASAIKGKIAGALAANFETPAKATAGATISPEVQTKSEEVGVEASADSPQGMCRDKLIAMGFSEEEADWAVQQATEQKSVDDTAEGKTELPVHVEAMIPDSSEENAAADFTAAGAPAESAMTECIRRAGCTCADCAEMAGLTFATMCPPVPSNETMGGAEEEVCRDDVEKEATQSAPTATPNKTPLKSTTKSTGASHHKSAAKSAVKSATKSAVRSRVHSESKTPSAAQATPKSGFFGSAFKSLAGLAGSAVKSAASVVKASPAVSVQTPSAASECIRKAGCTCADCAEMAGLSLTPGMPVENADEGEAHVSALPAVTEDGSEVHGTAAEESAALEDLAQGTKDDGTDAVEEEEAAMPESTLPVSKPAEETTAGEPPVEASEQALAAPMTTCIRRAGCTCVDCAEMAGITLADVCPTVSPAKDIPEAACEEPSHATDEQDPELAPATPEQEADAPAVEVQEEEQEEEPEGNQSHAVTDISRDPAADMSHGNAELETKTEGLVQASSPAPRVINSPPVKATQAAPVAVVPMATCIRRAGCTCVDCAEMAGLTLMPAAPASAAMSPSPAEPMVEGQEQEASDPTTSDEKKAAATTDDGEELEDSSVTPMAEPAPEAVVSVADAEDPEKEAPSLMATVLDSPPIKASKPPAPQLAQSIGGPCLRKAGCMCIDCAELAGLTLAAPPPATSSQCLRKAGCTCAECAAMAAVPAPVSGSVAGAPGTPSAEANTRSAQPQSSGRSAKERALKSAVKASPATMAADPDFRPVNDSPASPGFDDFDNTQALKEMMEDDMEDVTDLRISAVNEAMRAEMDAALAQHAASQKEQKADEESSAAKIREIASATVVSSNDAGARYTMEDVERISTFNMESLKRRMDAEVADLSGKLDAARAENDHFKTTMKEAEKGIDELVSLVEKEKATAAEYQKKHDDLKGYADELESSFNQLVVKYKKVKEWYKTSDANNEVLSKSMLESNEQVKTYKEQLQVANSSLKTIEDRVAAEKDLLKTEMSILNDKLSLAERERDARDSTILALRKEASTLQRALAEERMKVDDIKASFTVQLSAAGGNSKELEERAAAAEAQAKELRGQLKQTQELAAESVAQAESKLKVATTAMGEAESSSLKATKLQLQKAEMTIKSLQAQVDTKHNENEQLTKMCDELLSDLEKSKAK